jgi:hypothetical protein
MTKYMGVAREDASGVEEKADSEHGWLYRMS